MPDHDIVELPDWQYFPLGDGGALYSASPFLLLSLNHSASLIWQSLSKQKSVAVTTEELSDIFDVDAETLRNDVQKLVSDWQHLAATTKQEARTPQAPFVEWQHSQHQLRPGKYQRCYRLGTLCIRLWFDSANTLELIDSIYGYLRDEACASADIQAGIQKLGDRLHLVNSQQQLKPLTSDDELLQTLYEFFNEALYQHQNSLAALHAAALTADNQTCIVLPGESGAGKSTLSAYLGTQGWKHLADDTALFTGQGNVVPTPLPLTIKHPIPQPLSTRLPQLQTLPVYQRYGKSVSYLAPPSAVTTTSSYPLSALVFPSRGDVHPAELQALTPQQALQGLLNAGLFLHNPLLVNNVQALVGMLDRTPSYMLRYADVTDARHLLESIRKESM